MKIQIDWLVDKHECEACGSSYAYGALVSFDGVVVLEFLPKAHCSTSEEKTWDRDEVFSALLEKLGHTVQFEHWRYAGDE